MEFDETYFTNSDIGYTSYSDSQHFLDRATYIKDVLQPEEGVIILGGAIGYTNKYLDQFGINNINVDTSIYCYNNKVCNNFELDPTKVKYNGYDWIVSWSVLDCLTEDNVDLVCGLLNSFESVSKGNNLHVFSCSDNHNSQDYITDGYFIKSHDYWKQKLPTANLVCWDCKTVVQGDYHNIPIGNGVSD